MDKEQTKTKYVITPTVRQRRTARIIAEIAQGKHKDIKNNADIIKKAGYGSGLTTQPKRVLNSVGTTLALAELGFSSDTAKKVVAKILENDDAEDRDRLRAADIVFKVTGDYASDKIAKENNANPIIFAKIEHHIFNFESEIKKALGYESVQVIPKKDE